MSQKGAVRVFHFQDFNLPFLWPALITAGVVLGCVGLVIIIRAIARWVQLFRQPMVSLVLIPPTTTTQPIEATERLFTALHSLLQSSTIGERLVGPASRLSLEIVSTRPDGVRFLLRCPAVLRDAIEQMIAGFIPEAKVVLCADPLDGIRSGQVLRFKQKLHYAYPLETSSALQQQDPISYLTNAMTKLKDNELIAMQIVLQPTHIPEVQTLSGQIRRNEDVFSNISGRKMSAVTTLLSSASLSLLNLMSGLLNPGPRIQSSYQPTNVGAKPTRILTSFEYELVATLDAKLAKPLFAAAIRVIVVTNTKQAARLRAKSISAAMNLYSVSKYQRLVRVRLHFPWQRRITTLALRQRLPARRAVVLATHEVASLYHFPNSLNTQTDNLVTSLSRTLPAPISMKNGVALDLILGENTHHGVTTPIGLTAAERERHVYIVGGTGNGKTTMLLYGIIQDIKAGKGLAVIDPHGDLAETILHHIPEDRIADVIYLNPDDLEYPIGINLLELQPGLTGDDLLREKDLVTESVISVLRKIFSEDDSGGHRIEYVLRNAVQTALTLEGATLFTIFRLLNNANFRKDVVRNLEDQDLKDFWNNELGKAGDYQRVKMSAGITAKIGRFLFSASARRMLEQEKSSIDFEDILNSGKILVCNFSKGLLGEDSSTLFGTTVLAKLQIASLRRARLTQVERRPYHLYVDEFQNFATMSFLQMLSEARKYKLYLTMAEQSTAQQEEQRMVDIILANVGTVVCFRTGSPADEFKLLPLFKPYVQEGELSNLPSFSFYAKLAGTTVQEPLSGSTVLVSSPSISLKQRVIVRSRELYSLPVIIEARKVTPDSIAIEVAPRSTTSRSQQMKVF